MNLFKPHEIRRSEYLTRKLEAEKKAKENSVTISDVIVEVIIWMAVTVCAVRMSDFAVLFCGGGLLATYIHAIIRI